MNIKISKNTPQLIDLKSIGSPEIGYITVAEFPSSLPFEIKRTYWTYFTPSDIERGNHAHKELEQFIIAVSGTIEMDLESKDGKIFNFKLDNPNIALYIPKSYWRIIRFQNNAVLLCLASMEYSESDYIRNYEDFKKNE